MIPVAWPATASPSPSGGGTEVCVRPRSRHSAPHVVGKTVDELVADLGGLWRRLVTDLAAALAGPREGRHPPRHRRDRERGLGSLREARGQAALEAARGHDGRSRFSPAVDFRYIEDALNAPRRHSRSSAAARQTKGRA